MLGSKISNAIDTITSVAPHSRHGIKTLKYEMSLVMLSPEFMNGKIHKELKSGFTKCCRNDTHATRNTLKSMYLSSGSFSLSSIEILRSVEGLEKRERGFMPSEGQNKTFR